VVTEPLPSNFMGFYEVFCWDGVRCHDIRTKCQKDWFRHSNADGGGDTQTHRLQGDLISLLLILSKQGKEAKN
jgi:hypothetical protein